MWLLPGNGGEVGGEGVNVGGLSACTCTAKSTAGPGASLGAVDVPYNISPIHLRESTPGDLHHRYAWRII